MSVLGIDIGTSYCVLATIQRGAVTIVRNDLSERLTPALVGFTDTERLIGEDAQTQLRSNYRNTCRYIKQLLGCSESTPVDAEMEREFALAELDFGSDEEAGLAGYRVQYKREEAFFAATRIMAALLTKLKIIAEKATDAPVYDVVISVPGWFTDKARQAMLDAAEIAGLRCLRTMNDHAAVALDYGIYRSNTFDAERPSRVAFVGIGHGSTTVSVVEFVKGELRVLAVVSDKTLGGRHVDLAIMKHFAAIFAQRYNIDPMKNRKAFLKLEEAATKAKKVLSANSEAPFNIECLVEDYDINALLTRQEFEQLCAPLQERLAQVLEAAFASSGLNPDDVHHIELVGGCSRIPCFQRTVSGFFKDRLPLSKTLSMDETVARGCALQAAMLNPRYRVREFNVVDRALEDICVAWPSTTEDSMSHATDTYKTSVLFATGSPLGSTKWLTFQRESDLELRLAAGANGEPLVAHVEVPAEAQTPSELPKRLKIKARLSLHGTAAWETAQLLVDDEVEEVVKEKRPVDPATTTEGANATVGATDGGATDAATAAPPATQPGDEYIEVVKKKIKTKRYDCKLQTFPRRGYLTPEAKEKLAQSERSMAEEDYLQQRTKEAMNELEAYIYNLRDKLSEQLRNFASENEHHVLQQTLAATQDWVYDNPDSTRENYELKLQELQALGRPVERRYTELHLRKEAASSVFQTLADFRAASASPEFSHVDRAKMQSLLTKIADLDKWLTQVITTHDAAPVYQDPTVSASQILKEREALENFSRTVLVPKPAEPAPQQPAEQQSSSPQGKKHQDSDQSSPSANAASQHDDNVMHDGSAVSDSATAETDVPMN